MFFYENLYKSRRDGSEANKPNFNFEDLPIPTLSNDSSNLFFYFLFEKVLFAEHITTTYITYSTVLLHH